MKHLQLLTIDKQTLVKIKTYNIRSCEQFAEVLEVNQKFGENLLGHF
jgi:hypothetical protein